MAKIRIPVKFSNIFKTFTYKSKSKVGQLTEK